ncbi:hypothetical protein KIPE111705_41030 [Kibdelosporangium persicum]|uniref:Secreted protein n=1 Tax=Kibdelosporangium persicum TaxID=2698649 RepID=A0ABX2FJ78_9PSEU|nr:hypothetical protein [Kibdelosporangium persicum]NRN71298.1 hypothetical protein [Kibdelosporangium persicum]
MQAVRGQRGPRIWAVALGVVVIAAAGGFAARELYRQPETHTAVREQIVPVQPSTSVPLEQQPGSGIVTALGEFHEHPQSRAVWPMLQTHFDSINEKNYDKWRTTVTRARAAGFDERTWRLDYRSTRDGSILVHRMDSAPDRKLRVMVSFTSTQDIADAPPELPEPCIRWHIVLPLTREDNKWKIDVGPEGASPRHDKCGADTSAK